MMIDMEVYPICVHRTFLGKDQDVLVEMEDNSALLCIHMYVIV